MSTKVPLPLADRLDRIRRLQDAFLHKGQAVMRIGVTLTQIDMLLLAAAKRSVALPIGFIAMIEARNFQAASPMVRMQLDTALRIAALAFVPDAEAYAAAVMKGEKIYKLKDDAGKKLTDHRLLERVAAAFPWVTRVYEDASAFVHLSDRHLWTSIARTDALSRTVHFMLAAEDPPRVCEADYYEAVDAFYRSLQLAKGFVLSAMEQRAGRPSGPAL